MIPSTVALSISAARIKVAQMADGKDFLRDAKIFEIIGGIFGWLWLASTIAGIVWLAGALFGDFSWLVTLGLLLGSGFFKAVAREYNRSAQEAIAKGVDAGLLYVDSDNFAQSVSTGRAMPDA